MHVTRLMALLVLLAFQQKGTTTIAKGDPLPAKPGLVRRNFAKSFYMLNVPGGWKPEKRPGLILFMHGSGGRAEGAIGTFTMALDKGYILFSPETIAENRMAWDPDEDGKNIIAMIEEVIRVFNVDRDRLLCSGFSAGGAQTIPQMCVNVDFFTAGSPCGGCCYSAELEKNPALSFYVYCGKKDAIAYTGAEQAYDSLDKKGFNVRFIAPENIGHAMEPGGWQKIFDWFDGLIPEEQLPYFHGARDFMEKKQPGKAVATLKKLAAMKTVTRHAKGRCDRLCAQIEAAGADELAKAKEIEDPKKAVEALTKLKASYDGAEIGAKIEAALKELKK